MNRLVLVVRMDKEILTNCTCVFLFSRPQLCFAWLTITCNMVCRLKDKHERKTPYSLDCQIMPPPPPNIVVFFSKRNKLSNIFVHIFMQEGGLSKQRETTYAAYTEVWNSAELSYTPRTSD